MDQLTLVEVRNPQGITTARLRSSADVITVGRGPRNEVVVDDEYVDETHLHVSVGSEENGLTIRDVGSTNGTKVDGVLIGGTEVTIPYGKPIVVGRTTLIFTSAAESVSPAKRLPDAPKHLLAYHRLPAWTLALVLVVLSTMTTAWSSYAPVSMGRVIGIALALALLLLTWAGAWALGTRIASGSSRFREHLGFASLIGLLVAVLSTLLYWVTFAVGSPLVDTIVDRGFNSFLTWSVVLLGHLDIASRRSGRFKMLIAGGISAILLVLGIALNGIDLSPSVEIGRSLRPIPPVPAWMTRSTSVQHFLDTVKELETELEREASETDQPETQ